MLFMALHPQYVALEYYVADAFMLCVYAVPDMGTAIDALESLYLDNVLLCVRCMGRMCLVP